MLSICSSFIKGVLLCHVHVDDWVWCPPWTSVLTSVTVLYWSGCADVTYVHVLSFSGSGMSPSDIDSPHSSLNHSVDEDAVNYERERSSSQSSARSPAGMYPRLVGGVELGRPSDNTKLIHA